jgi:hypothetical protein
LCGCALTFAADSSQSSFYLLTPRWRETPSYLWRVLRRRSPMCAHVVSRVRSLLDFFIGTRSRWRDSGFYPEYQRRGPACSGRPGASSRVSRVGPFCQPALLIWCSVCVDIHMICLVSHPGEPRALGDPRSITLVPGSNPRDNGCATL